jgi:hypothetical protein
VILVFLIFTQGLHESAQEHDRESQADDPQTMESCPQETRENRRGNPWRAAAKQRVCGLV